MNGALLQIDRFTFEIKVDPTADALSAIEIMIFFMGEPCCDDNGHQYRLYMPAGLKESSVKDLCRSFARAIHCEQQVMAA